MNFVEFAFMRQANVMLRLSNRNYIGGYVY